MKNTGSRTAWALGAAVLTGGMTTGTAQAQVETPRGEDGHPILSGLLVGGGARLPTSELEDAATVFRGRGGTYVGLEADGAIRRTSNDNHPLYKPEYWDQITHNDYFGNWDDPVSFCFPLGTPRSGAPHQIVEVKGQPAVILVYQAGFNGYGGSYRGWDDFRFIWTDGREHDPGLVARETLKGASVGHWEGDTLVIESIGFTDDTWLHKNGWIHGYNMKVTERLTRVGNALVWEATVEDPEYFQEPWVMTPMVAQYNTNPDAYIPEGLPCLVREPYASHVRSG